MADDIADDPSSGPKPGLASEPGDKGGQGLPASKAQHVAQGDVFVAANDTCQVGMVLGSCVATVLWDDAMGVGGVNHLLLPPVETVAEPTLGLQVNLMERLINGVLGAGGRRGHLRAKVFGGARMISGLSDAGARNGAFVMQFLSDEGIDCVARSLGGASGRRLRIWPATGRVMQRRLPTDASHVVGDTEWQTSQSQLCTGDDTRHSHVERLRLSGVELL